MREIVSPLDGIRSPFGFIRGGGVVPFSPASLFASGEEGAWYEPSTTTCFTDTGGTTPATYGDGVAYLEDLSGNGNHATQSTASARPILARVPEGGRRNELSETDTLATQSVTVTAAQRTLSFTGTGTVTLTGASTAGPLVGTGAADRVSLTFTPSAGTLTLTVLGTTTDAQLELGAAATTYQSVADSLGYDVTEAGVTSLDYLAFDGSDDGMATASIDFTGTDKMSVFAGVESEADAAGFITEMGATFNYNGSFSVRRRFDAVYVYTLSTSTSTSTGFSNTITSARPAPDIAVLSFEKDLAGATEADKSVFSRVNGASDIASSFYVGPSTATVFQNLPLNIGARNNAASVWFDGKIFGLIVRGAASTAQEISDTESYVANLSGVSL